MKQVAVLGGNGYVGRELLSLLKQHPQLCVLEVANIEACLAQKIEVVFLATPPDVSMKAASILMNTKVKIIDLSGAFRLSRNEFEAWYGMQHEAPHLIEKACYGLSPFATAQSKAQLIANPGCYATAALMALLPLYQKITIQDNIIIDAKSGVSGAGKKANSDLMFCEISQNFYPYKIGKHQHTPEVMKAIHEFSNVDVSITLTTSILPVARGIAMSIYIPRNSLHPSEIFNAFHTSYASYPLIVYREVGLDDKNFLALQAVVHTPCCHIGFYVNQTHIVLFSSIDNLLKGAASQAIENMNAMFQFPIHTGLWRSHV